MREAYVMADSAITIGSVRLVIIPKVLPECTDDTFLLGLYD